VAKKNQARFEKLRDFKPKNNRFSTTYKSTAKIITLGDLNDGAYNKSVKVALGAKAKKRQNTLESYPF
jgi:hypothetical protein